MTQQDADATPDVVTSMISILDHDAYTLVDPGATHSFSSKHFLDRFQIKTGLSSLCGGDREGGDYGG